MDGYLKRTPGFETRATHAGQEPEQWNCHAVIPGLFCSTTYKQAAPAEHKVWIISVLNFLVKHWWSIGRAKLWHSCMQINFQGFEYSRSGNPTRNVLEKCLAGIEGAKHGLVYASGLGATTALAHLLNAGEHIVSIDDVYGGTNRYFTRVLSNMNINVDYVDARHPEKVKNALKPNTKVRQIFFLIWNVMQLIHNFFKNISACFFSACLDWNPNKSSDEHCRHQSSCWYRPSEPRDIVGCWQHLLHLL